MKPLVSAAAAVFLLAARRKPPDVSADGPPPSSVWPLVSESDADSDIGFDIDPDAVSSTSQDAETAEPEPVAEYRPPVGPALFDALRARAEAADDPDTALGMLKRGLRIARRAAARKAAEDARAGGAAAVGADADRRHLLGDLFGDGGDESEGGYDVRPLLAVSMGVTLFLLTRSPRDGYTAELERTGGAAGIGGAGGVGGIGGEGSDVGAEALRMLEQLRIGTRSDNAQVAEVDDFGDIDGLVGGEDDGSEDDDDMFGLRGASRAAAAAGGVTAAVRREPVDWVGLSDMRSRKRDIVIVTTAALPWMTGTAVNPLLRAVYLAKVGHSVTLVVPWLESPEDQRKVFPSETLFASKEQQKKVILDWAKEQVPAVELTIRFFEGVYSNDFGSIMPLGDLTSMFAEDPVRDVCVLEEPEHLTWHHTGKPWTKVFDYCVGIIHTNYTSYARESVFGPASAVFLHFLNQWCARAYCHRVIKLSDAVQEFPHSVTCNVHGVRDHFLKIGKERRGKPFEKDVYFLGKVLWTKGYRELADHMEAHFDRTGEKLAIDFFGAGPDLPEVKKRVRGSKALSEVNLHGVVVQHHSEYLQRYKVFVNPSKSDVVCTATAEALAMGKFVVCLRHPSNEFFATFDNCLIYETDEQFSSQLAYAMANEPAPLSERDLHRLSWEAATERFYDASLLGGEPVSENASDVRVHSRSPMSGRAPPGGRVDSALAVTHKTICSTLVATPASVAVRQRYRAERKVADEARRKQRARERSRILL